MKKGEYSLLRSLRGGLDLDYETKRIAYLILEREGKLVKEQLCVLESKEDALEKQIEKLEEELCKVRSGIRRLEHKQDMLYDVKIHL